MRGTDAAEFARPKIVVQTPLGHHLFEIAMLGVRRRNHRMQPEDIGSEVALNAKLMFEPSLSTVF